MSTPPEAQPSQQLQSTAEATTEDSVGTPAERRERRWSPLLGLAAVVVYAGLGLGAALTAPVAFLVLLVASQAVDALIVNDDYVRAVLARGQFGIGTRSITRELLALALVLGAPWAATRTREAAALCLLAVGGLRLLYLLALVPVRRRALVPVETRGIDLTGLRLPPRPPELVMSRPSERAHHLSIVALVGAAAGVAAKSPAAVFAVVGAVLLVEIVAVGLLARLLAFGQRALDRDQLLAAVQERVAALRPEVVLYHTGDPDTAYQANMWLTTVDRLPDRCLIVLRERPILAELNPSRTPVICIPGSVDFMMFALPDVRVAMYTANVGKTIHLLREPGIRHVFIGHGDSDKSASSNPFSRVYSEIWVAGAAGRERYRRANVGVREEDIVEVGRPQLTDILPATRSLSDGVVSVLYAPTWEGWTGDPAHTSVVLSGPALVERLVALPGIRVIYKPHPLTGSVAPSAAAADVRIRAVIARANAAGSAPVHRVAVGPQPSLYDCFNDADVLVADISSVLTDFIGSQKPYVVPNLTAMGEDEFRATFPSASAAYLLDRGAEQIGAVLDLVRGPDPLAGPRRDLKRYLLGPDDPDAMTRFAAAVGIARDRAVALWPVRPTLTVTAV